MRILFITHFFVPEELSGAYLVKELADAAIEAGHDVDILTGYPNWPSGQCFKGYDSGKFQLEKMGQLNVYRIPFWAAPNGRFLRRVLDFKTFEYGIRKYGKKLPRPDVIFVPVPPNEDALAARYLARHFNCKYVVNVQDIQPDSAIKLGYIRNPLAIHILRWQEQRMYRDAAHVVAIGENFEARLIKKGIPKAKISVLPNWINARDVIPMSRSNALRLEWHIPDDKFVVLYAGTFGRIHGTDILIQAARQLMHLPRVLFLMVGQGYDFDRCVEMVEKEGLTNVLIKEFVPRSRLSEMQALADVSVVTMRAGFGHTSVPSKVLGYMAAGRGVLALADIDCDTARLIDSAKCGLVVAPEKIETLVKEITGLVNDLGRVECWGKNARQYILANLDSQVVPRRGIELLEKIAR